MESVMQFDEDNAVLLFESGCLQTLSLNADRKSCFKCQTYFEILWPNNFDWTEWLLYFIDIELLKFQADIDNSGTIDYGEFIAATLHLNKIEREDNLFSAFSYFDKDGSGYITQDELQKACDEFGIEDVRIEEIIQEIDQDNVSHVLTCELHFSHIKHLSYIILFNLELRMEG